MYSSSAGSALTALQHAVALPDVFSPQEYVRALRRNHDDVTKAAVQLKAKHAWLKKNQFDNLSLAKPSVQREVKKQYLQVLHDATDKCKCPIVVFSVAKFHPTQSSDKLVAGKEQCTDHGGVSLADDSTSTIEDARRLIVYMVTLAVELMEDENAPGIIYLVDMDGVSTNVVTEGSVHIEFLRMLKEYFPETVQFCFVVNFSTNSFVQQATAYVLKSLGVSDRTHPKIKFIKDVRELHPFFHAPALPESYGGASIDLESGAYKLMTSARWMEVQADIEGLDLDNLPADEETTFMTKQARELNGMQYAACSVGDVVEMNTTVLRGPLWRNKSGISWVKTYAVLRPDALLLYEDIKGTMPMVIIPVNHEVAIAAAQFDNAPRGTFGFRVDVDGVPGGHLLAAMTEKERGNWLQDIQMGIQAFQELHAREVYEEERKLRMDHEFEKLNMIDFSTELPVQQLPPATSPLIAHPPVAPTLPAAAPLNPPGFNNGPPAQQAPFTPPTGAGGAFDAFAALAPPLHGAQAPLGQYGQYAQPPSPPQHPVHPQFNQPFAPPQAYGRYQQPAYPPQQPPFAHQQYPPQQPGFPHPQAPIPQGYAHQPQYGYPSPPPNARTF